MQKKYWIIPLCAAVLFPLHTRASVVIQSVEPGSPTASDEYMVLFNPDETAQDLTGWSIQEKSDTAAAVLKKNFSSGMAIPAHSSILVANSSGIYAAKALMTYASFSLPQSGATVVVAPTTTILASFPNSPNAVVYHYDSSSQNTTSTTDIAVSTPTNTSAVSAAPDVFVTKNDPPPYLIQLTELFPHPTDYKTEFIELYNPNPVAVSVAGFSIQDAGGATYLLGTHHEPTTLMPQEYRVWPRSLTNIALNDTDGEQIILRNEKGMQLDQMTYTEDAPRNVSYALIRGGWHWTATPTPNAENFLDELPAPPVARAVIPSGPLYVGEQMQCSAEDTTDPNNDIQKYTWDFGDGLSADGMIVTHTFAASGTYTVQFTATDSLQASSTVFKTVTVKDKEAPTATQTTPQISGVLIAAAQTDTTIYATSTTPKTTAPLAPMSGSTTHTGIVAIAPGILGPLTIVASGRTITFTTARTILKKLTAGTRVSFTAHEKLTAGRIILVVAKNDQFKITGTTEPPPATTISGTVTEINASGSTIAASSTIIMLPKKGSPVIPPALQIGDAVSITGFVLADDAMTPIMMPTEKIIVHQTAAGATQSTLQSFLLMYGSGVLLIILYFVLTQKRMSNIYIATKLKLQNLLQPAHKTNDA